MLRFSTGIAGFAFATIRRAATFAVPRCESWFFCFHPARRRRSRSRRRRRILPCGGQPIEINATGETNYDNGLATAHDNVAIHIGDTDIYADDANYNHRNARHARSRARAHLSRTSTALCRRDGDLQHATRRAIQSDDMRSMQLPVLRHAGKQIDHARRRGRLVQQRQLSRPTIRANPDFSMRARRMRIYEGDRVIIRDVTFYVGQGADLLVALPLPVARRSFSYMISPAYLSSWGPSLLGHVTFPISDHINATMRLDYRGRRGVAIGF